MQIPPIGHTVLVKRNASVIDVAETMRDIIREMSDDDFVLEQATEIMWGIDHPDLICQAIADYAYNAVYFEPDPITSQKIRTPRRSIADARGNCVDYTVLMGSIAHAMGLPVRIRIVKLPGQNQFGHVYPVISGVAIDLVPIQREDGLECLYREPGITPVPGQELPYVSKQDFYI